MIFELISRTPAQASKENWTGYYGAPLRVEVSEDIMLTLKHEVWSKSLKQIGGLSQDQEEQVAFYLPTGSTVYFYVKPKKKLCSECGQEKKT